MREFAQICSDTGVRAVLHSDPDHILKPGHQPVRALDYVVDDIAAVEAACEAAGWRRYGPNAISARGIVLRLHTTAATVSALATVQPLSVRSVAQSSHIQYGGLDIEIEPGVFEADPKSVYLADSVIREMADVPAPVIVDVGTGSGAIALAIAAARPDARLIGTDISDDALACARRNAERNNIHNMSYYRGSLLEPLPEELKGQVDAVVANIPWVCALEIAVSRLEEWYWRGPLETILGTGSDGLDLLRELLEEARTWLKPEGVLVSMSYRWQRDQLADEIADDYDILNYMPDEPLIVRLKASAARSVP